MPNLYELDKTKPYYRGKLLRQIRVEETPGIIGTFGVDNIPIYPYIIETGGEMIKPGDLGVNGYMFSEKLKGSNDWETIWVIDPDHYKKCCTKTDDEIPH